MQEILLSPGVLALENDTSQITQAPLQPGAAIIGPTYKGKVGVPKIVTTYSQYLAYFGGAVYSGSQQYTFLTDFSVKNYFANGGGSMIVTRVQSGSNWSAATASIYASGAVKLFDLEFLSDGVIGNSTGTLYSDGTLANGTKNNLRYEISTSDSSSGLFTVTVRRGDDSTKNPIVLETFTNCSLDPMSNTYVARVIGDKENVVKGAGTADVYIQSEGNYANASNYVRVSSVYVTTPNYLLPNGTANPAYTGSMPLVTSGSFGGGTGDPAAIPSGSVLFFDKIANANTQGVTPSDYADAINLMANKDDYQFNIISTPGLIYELTGHGTVIDTLISVVENRGDAIYPVDLVDFGSTPTDAVTQAKNVNSSYAASYYPWCQVQDSNTGQLVWVPSTTMIPGVYAYTDKVSEPWFAPAGINRGGLTTVQQAERKLSNTVRDQLYVGKVNPIGTFPRNGVVVFGNKTLQTQASALDRVNVRRLLIQLKGYITQVANNMVFEQNSVQTRNNFLTQVNPYLDVVQQRQGLYAYRVQCDETNNTPQVIDRNELQVSIFLQPTKTAEFIYLNFNITPTGVTFA